MSQAFRAASETRTGMRARNEDAAQLAPQLGLAVLADGMGGAPGGRQASRLAVEAAVSFWADREQEGCGERELLDRLGCAVEQANRRVLEFARAKHGFRGMGTTLVMLLIRNGRYYLANVGDSRAHRIRDGICEAISRDHSLVQERLDAGLISPAEAAVQPDRNVLTRAVGTEPTVEPQLLSGEVAEGDVFVLTSDGVHDVLSPEEIAGLAAGEDPDTASRALVERALERGSRDNVTAAVISLR